MADMTMMKKAFIKILIRVFYAKLAFMQEFQLQNRKRI